MSSPLNLTRVSPVLSSLYSRTGPFLSLADYRTGAFTGQDNEASLNVQHRVERSEAERSELHALLRGGQAGDPQAQETGGATEVGDGFRCNKLASIRTGRIISTCLENLPNSVSFWTTAWSSMGV